MLTSIHTPWHDSRFRQLTVAVTVLLFLSIALSLLFQIATDGICHSKALFMFVASVLFWLPVGHGLHSRAKAQPLALRSVVLLGLAVLAVNQVFVRYSVEFSMQVCFHCSRFSDSWIPYFVSNNLVVNLICYAGFVGFAKKRAAENRPEENVPKKENTAEPSGKLLVKDGANRFWLDTCAIRWVEVEDNCITIVTDRRKIVLYQSLKSFAACLDPAVFKRIHRSKIVNTAHVSKVTNLPSGDGLVQMRCGTQFRVSRLFKKNLLA
jgi:hypothetical protein